MIENLLYNERRQKDSIKLFEIGDIYTKKDEILQNKKLGIIASGRLGNNYEDFSKKLDDKYLDKILNINLSKPFFIIEEISRNDLETKRKDKIFYIEVSIDKIPHEFFSDLDHISNPYEFIRYQKISEFPSSSRDFSFLISDPAKVNEVIKLLHSVSDDIIKESFIFDFYINQKDSTVKLGYRFIFQSLLKTLSDNEINIKSEEILAPILQVDGVSIPGMNPNNK